MNHRSSQPSKTKTENMPQPSTNSISNARKVSKSLFSVTSAQSLISQLDDAILVLRWIIRSVKNSQSPSKFAVQYVLNPTFKNDLFVISFGLPALSDTPRVLDGTPSIRSNASNWTYHGEQTARARRGLLNVASYNYLGFIDLEYNTRKLLEYATQKLPFADDERGCNRLLEEEVKTELRELMGLKGCALTPSGYGINLVAFPAMAASSNGSRGNSASQTVFLMDSESHSSMFMGAFIACCSGKATVIKFRHNDIDDLAAKLEDIQGPKHNEASQNSAKQVWVTVEGLYSMDGTLAPLKEIVALKRKYGFRIYLDEAHSFLSIGRSGRGVVEYFCDDDTSESVQTKDIDMIGGTLSKSLSSVGGFVLCSEPLTEHVEARLCAMQTSGDSSIPTLALIRTLQILKKPNIVAQRLAHLRAISTYVADTLAEKGYQISTTRGGPIVAVILDTLNRVLDFLRIGREIGLICCGAAYPVAPRGAPRIRLSLTSAHTWQDVSEMLQLIDHVAMEVGVKGLKLPKHLTILDPSAAMKETLESHSASSLDEVEPAKFSDEVDASILAICPLAVNLSDSNAPAIRNTGLSALSRYNLGASGPRWMYGTFSAHLSLEQLLNSTIEAMVSSAMHSEKTSEQIQTTLFTDARIGIMSIIAVSMEGLARRRSKKGERHLVLLPQSAGLEIMEGAAMAQRDKSTKMRWYGLSDDLNSDCGDCCIEEILAQECSDSAKAHITLYLDTGLLNHSSTPENVNSKLDKRLSRILSPLSALRSSPTTKHPITTTIIIKDPHFFTSNFSSSRNIISSLKSIFPDIYSSSSIRFLLCGSFHALPHLPGLQGGFCTGSKRLVEKVQFLGQGVMYTAMMPPMTAAMAEESIRRMLKG